MRTPEMMLMFPNLTKLAAVELILPVSTVDCGRGISTLLSRIKTDLRNRLNDNTLSFESLIPSIFHMKEYVIFGQAKRIEKYRFNL